MQMVIMRMRDQDQIDRRNLIQRKPRRADPLLEAEPAGPDRIRYYVEALVLQKKGGVPDPCNRGIQPVSGQIG
ncbi:hypothetical protein D3C75_1239240 [compost metagenome]